MTALASWRAALARRWSLAVAGVALLVGWAAPGIRRTRSWGVYQRSNAVAITTAEVRSHTAGKYHLVPSDTAGIMAEQLRRSLLLFWRYRDASTQFGMKRPLLDPIEGALSMPVARLRRPPPAPPGPGAASGAPERAGVAPAGPCLGRGRARRGAARRRGVGGAQLAGLSGLGLQPSRRHPAGADRPLPPDAATWGAGRAGESGIHLERSGVRVPCFRTAAAPRSIPSRWPGEAAPGQRSRRSTSSLRNHERSSRCSSSTLPLAGWWTAAPPR